MRNSNKSYAGAWAKKVGDQFENILSNTAQIQGWTSIELPKSGARAVGKNRFVRQRMPFDFAFFKNKKAIFCDAKTIKGNTYPFSALTYHQCVNLKNIEDQGFTAGYVISFRLVDEICFFTATQLLDLKPGYSLLPENGILLGSENNFKLDLIFK